MIKITKYKNIFLSISAIMMAASIWSIAYFGFSLGIDFTGGSLWQIEIAGTSSQEVKNFFSDNLDMEISTISYDEASGMYSLTLKELKDEERQSALVKLQENFEDVIEQDFWSISPSVSEEIKSKAMQAIVFVLVGISLYIAFVFRKVSRPVSSWKYGIITLLTLLHDVVIPAGVFAMLSRYGGVLMDTNFIVALLVVMGFSVHDTIVVFDRVRENILKSRNKDMGEIVDMSVGETITRSINTSLTLIIVLVALYFLGPLSLKYFVLAMLIGTTVGTYSSIFVASPMLLLFQKLSKKS